MNLKYLPFLRFSHIFFQNTATYHQMREPVRSSNTADPIVDHTPSPCFDTHTAVIAGIEMDTRSESTSIARLVCYDCNTDGVGSVCL